jgi:hypothetical protein
MHSFEEYQSAGHSNPIEEPENSVSSEESLWRENFLRMGEEEEIQKQKEIITFEFPIQDSNGMIQMKNIMPSFPNFFGFPREDPDTFLFELDVLGQRYNYSSNSYKLKIFPATLKEESLR